MEEIERIKQELERTKFELDILYQISNAMRTTLRLDEVLYIILTGVTAHIGLGFNRAVLFLINDRERLIEGKMGIGPETDKEANSIWTQIEEEKMSMDDLINTYRVSRHIEESRFNKQVQELKVPLQDKSEDLLCMVALEGMPLHLTKDTIGKYNHAPIIKLLNSEEAALVPLKAKNKVNGIIVADNFVTKK